MLEKIEQALQEIERTGRVPVWIRDDPATLIGEWYDQWVADGGKIAGKNRRSIRNMAVWLSRIRTIRSLPQKLRGDIRLGRDDAHALIVLFLSGPEETLKAVDRTDPEAGRLRPFVCTDPQRLATTLVDAMFSDGGPRSIQLRRSRRERSSGSEQITSPAVYKEMFGRSDALIVFSRHRSIANESVLVNAMEVFWHILEGFSDVINDDKPHQTVIWIIDLGNRQVEDKNAWRDFINVQILKAQFEAFAHFDSQTDATTTTATSPPYQEPLDAFDREIAQKIQMPPIEHRAQRWRKLSRRAIFVVEHLREEEISHFFPDEYQEDKRERVKDIGVFPEHILPFALPVMWTKLTRLYPDHMRDVSDATFVTTISLASDNATRPEINYFAYTPVLKGPIRGGVAQIGLDPPGEAYDKAFQLVYSAARYRLSERFEPDGKRKHGGRIAVRYLRKMGFEVLTVRDLFNLLSAEPNASDGPALAAGVAP